MRDHKLGGLRRVEFIPLTVPGAESLKSVGGTAPPENSGLLFSLMLLELTATCGDLCLCHSGLYSSTRNPERMRP